MLGILGDSFRDAGNCVNHPPTLWKANLHRLTRPSSIMSPGKAKGGRGKGVALRGGARGENREN